MSCRIFSAAIQGIDAQLVEVEVDSSPGLYSFNIVGLPDKAVEESKDRIAAAIKNSGLLAPTSKHKKITINLAPADMKKEGPAYDLPIAIGYLCESNQVKFNTEKRLFVGELSLDGSLRHTNGILAIALMAKHLGFHEIIIPLANVKEASVVSGIKVIGASNIRSVLGHIDGTGTLKESSYEHNLDEEPLDNPLLHIKGQETAKRALVVAAAGAHNILMSGAPGSGKTLLAKALSDLLPPLSLDEALEVAKIYSSVGLIKNSPLSFKRPFRSPHHTTSAVAVVGGGTLPKPGEISLAHRGVLFLDELPEFPRNVLESLRQPLEDGQVSIARAAGSLRLPAKFTLVAAMNPCPCGNYGDPINTCTCPAFSVLKYRKKISGPLLDRIDIQVSVPRETIFNDTMAEFQADVSDIRLKIAKAREVQAYRLAKFGLFTNSEISHRNIELICRLEPSSASLLKRAISSRGLSLRAYHKIMRIGRTIADLEQSEAIKDNHIAEALALRVNEKMLTELI